MTVRVTLTTAGSPGAVAILQLTGRPVPEVLSRLTGQSTWPPARLKYVDFAGIDAGLAVTLRDDWAQLMPHGGPRVVQKLIEHLVALGCKYDAAPSSRQTYPEAGSELEADMLAAIARAASPAAIDLLLRQPENWRRRLASLPPLSSAAANLLARSRILDRLIDPPCVVVIGRPNVGKSTLANRMLGRDASIVADMPGTTRDWVAGLAELPPGIAVRWMDTPGLRTSDDAIEQRAIELANGVIRDADVVIVMRDPGIDWPDEASLPREPDVWVINKIDEPNGGDAGNGAGPASPLRISAEHGGGLGALTRCVIARLGLHETAPDEPWAFSQGLKVMLHPDRAGEMHLYAGE
jgi:tRNA modification GTPase